MPASRFQFRRANASAWTSANPTLAAGELGYELDTGKFKIGDGTTAWNSLVYAANSSGTETLSNKTINLGSNTIRGSLTDFNSALTDQDFATLGGTETLTFKTLTNPTLTTPNLGAGTASSLTVTGTVSAATLSSSGAITTTTGAITTTSGTVSGTVVSAGSVNSTGNIVAVGNITTGTGAITTTNGTVTASALSASSGTISTGFGVAGTVTTAALAGAVMGTATPGTLTTSGTAGALNTVSRSDHAHPTTNLLTTSTTSTGIGGTLVYSGSPTLVSPSLGTPGTVILTNATGLPISSGLTGFTTKGDLIVYTGSTVTRFGTGGSGSNGLVLTADSTTTEGVSWTSAATSVTSLIKWGVV